MLGCKNQFLYKSLVFNSICREKDLEAKFVKFFLSKLFQFFLQVSSVLSRERRFIFYLNGRNFSLATFSTLEKVIWSDQFKRVLDQQQRGREIMDQSEAAFSPPFGLTPAPSRLSPSIQECSESLLELI